MEKLKEKNDKIEKQKIVDNQTENKAKRQFTVFAFSIWEIVIYFIIYSIIGFFIETIFGLITKGVIESRKNFLYGPFCCIYGVGGLVAIVGLQKFKKNNYTIFAGGALIGSFVEYFISLIGEFVFHIKWWDYSNLPFNINGRICIAFSVLWGFLAIFFLRNLHPHVEKFVGEPKP